MTASQRMQAKVNPKHDGWDKYLSGSLHRMQKTMDIFGIIWKRG